MKKRFLCIIIFKSAGMDVILVMSANGRISTADAYVRGYQPPTMDPKNDVVTDNVQMNGNVLRAQFSRALGTNEGPMYDANLDGCVTWHVSLNRFTF